MLGVAPLLTLLKLRPTPARDEPRARAIAELVAASRAASAHAHAVLDAVPLAIAEVMRRTPDDVATLTSLDLVADAAQHLVVAEAALVKARGAFLKDGGEVRVRRGVARFMAAAAAFHVVLFGHAEPDDHLTAAARIGIERTMSPDPGDQLIGGRTLSQSEKAELSEARVAGRAARDPRRASSAGERYLHGQIGGTPTQRAITAAAARWWPAYARVVSAARTCN